MKQLFIYTLMMMGMITGVSSVSFAQDIAQESAPILRVARPSDDLDALKAFYMDGLGLTLIDQFKSHDGFDGIMMGKAGWPYHFEFTKFHGHVAGHVPGQESLKAPTEDNLIVFYMPDRAVWQAATARMEAAGYTPVTSFNPYWDVNGKTYEDPDGYRVVLQNSAWE